MVGFTTSACFIHDLTRELMVGKGRKVYNLYVLDSGYLLHASFNNNQNEIVFASFIDIQQVISVICYLIVKLMAFPLLGLSYFMKQYLIFMVHLFLTPQKLSFHVLLFLMILYLLNHHLPVKHQLMSIHLLM